MAAKEIASDIGSRAALCGRCLPRQAPAPSARCIPRRTVCAERSTGGSRDTPSHVVRAVAAPEKASSTPPPFEAWNTGKDVKQRTDIKTIMILGAGPIVIGQVRHPSYFAPLQKSIYFIVLTLLLMRRPANSIIQEPRLAKLSSEASAIIPQLLHMCLYSSRFLSIRICVQGNGVQGSPAELQPGELIWLLGLDCGCPRQRA